jgi:hypothetical protein
MEEVTEVRLLDFSDVGYRAMQSLQKFVAEKTLVDGKARWVLPNPGYFVKAVTEDFTVTVGVIFSGDATADMPWTAAKAYIYALYMGAAERIKKRARRDGPRRFVGVDEEASADAQLMGMHVKVTVVIRAV